MVRPELKKQVAEKVLSLLVSEGCYAFGGFVRDSVAGKDFEDIDLFFKDEFEYSNFVECLTEAGYTVPFIRTGKYVKRCLHEVREIRTSRHGDTVCKIDCIIGNGMTNQVGPMLPGDWDANINTIAMGKDKKIFSLVKASDKELNKTLDQIRKHTFTSLPGMTEFRMNKLLKKGFKEVMATPQSEEVSFFESFKTDIAPEVAYRVTATQLVKATKQGALLAVAAKGGNSETTKTVSEILNTEAGDIFASAMLALLCMYTPQLNQNPKVKRLAREFQITGMATGANAVLDIAREFLLPGLLDALKKLPEIGEEAKTQVRVTESLPAPTKLFEDSSDELESPPLKKAASL